MLSNLNIIPKDAIFALNQEFQNDPNPQKINLGVGIYLNDNKQAYVHPIIQQVAKQINTDNFNYNTIQGHKGFLEEATNLLYTPAQQKNLATQAISGGTHGCAVISDLLIQNSITNLILPIPTWGNHHKIFQKHNITTIPHLKSNKVNLSTYKIALEEAPSNSAILIHGAQAHNPTGTNFSTNQLDELIEIANQNKIFIILDFAYLGLSENFQTDLTYLHKFQNQAQNLATIISFSKNATLYEHRTGLLTIKSENKKAIESHLQRIVRQTISQPSGYGQKIMYKTLKHHKQEWLAQLESMNLAIQERRKQFFQNSPSNFQHLSKTKGMFTLLPINKNHIESLKTQHSIYIPSNGRINFGGLSPNDIPTLTNKLKEYNF